MRTLRINNSSKHKKIGGQFLKKVECQRGPPTDHPKQRIFLAQTHWSDWRSLFQAQKSKHTKFGGTSWSPKLECCWGYSLSSLGSLKQRIAPTLSPKPTKVAWKSGGTIKLSCFRALTSMRVTVKGEELSQNSSSFKGPILQLEPRGLRPR